MYKFNLTSKQSELRQLISKNYRISETQCVNQLINSIKLNSEQEQNIKKTASELIEKIRNKRTKGHGIDVIMNKFKLTTNEGIALMCLAESLLRIPDKKTQNNFIKDQLAKGNWQNFIHTENLFINATSWGLLITKKLITAYDIDSLANALYKLIAKGGEPLIRKALISAINIMGNQFVMSETIDKALKIAKSKEKHGYKFSFDMLGEAAYTNADAQLYLQNYITAIHAIGKYNKHNSVYENNGISVKLSAIHPRYTRLKYDRVMTELYDRLKQLFKLAKQYNIGLFIDAEESSRLEISLDLLEKLVNDVDIKGFQGIGFVIQTYQKRAPYVIDYIAELSRETNTKIMVRLVKGAYWDSEIKQAQIDGQIDYPVFTRKFYTDLCYIACVEKLFNYQNEIYPLFATHNAYSLALVDELGKGKEYEFQCLYGMGETLYDNVVGSERFNKTCRVYAPVGTYEVLLSYLVRRILENGANSSFIHQLVNKDIPIQTLVESPILLSKITNGQPNPYFSSPLNIYPNNRLNSKGLDLTNEITLTKLSNNLNQSLSNKYLAYPLIADTHYSTATQTQVLNPANTNDVIGNIVYASEEQVETAVMNAVNGFKTWSQLSNNERGNILLKVADLLELNHIELINLLIREAGKTIGNAINEIREAVDFCRYYATITLTELNNQSYSPIGVIVCISPWNFPLAIFIGEISSALVTGNTVIAKPSNQTNLIAFYTVNLFYQAGVPHNALQMLPGSGSILGNRLTKHQMVNGVIFTGSTQTAQMINKNLSLKNTNYILIAETGGQNAMIVDSTALPEQVVADVISSGFDSAGQRCSALRVLYLQSDIADKIIEMLKGAMDELQIGDPMDIATDIGPIIDKTAKDKLLSHIANMKNQARPIYQTKFNSSEYTNGFFIPPTIIEINSISELKQEHFGPIIHIIRFANNELDHIINEINSSGYGLTQGIHSRINTTAKHIYEKIKAGNIYVNRNMVGAVVGVQPFGGEGMSGTGPKAGGPLYLYRLIKINSNPQLGSLLDNNMSNELNDLLVQLTKIFDDTDYKYLLKYAKKISDEVLINRRVDLAGPTGETNFMYFDARGFVGLFANNIMAYAKQIICAIATKNKIILPYNDITKVFNKLVCNNIFFCENVKDIEELNAVLISSDYLHINELRNILANRSGLLVLTILEQYDGFYPLYLLTTERSVSINLTATGGNLQLVSIEDKVI